jgi:hypothetical protein
MGINDYPSYWQAAGAPPIDMSTVGAMNGGYGTYGPANPGAMPQAATAPTPNGMGGFIAPGGAPGQLGAGGAAPAFSGQGVPNGQGPWGNPFEAWANPKEAIMRSLMNTPGVNPAFGGASVDFLLKKAEDIVYQAIGRLAAGGQENLLAGGGFNDLVNNLVGGALSGTRSPLDAAGSGAGREGLNAINRLVQGVMTTPGGGSQGAQILADLLRSSPENAADMAGSLLYGSMGARGAAALSRPLALLPTAFHMQGNTPEGFAAQKNRGPLDFLLSNYHPQIGMR